MLKKDFHEAILGSHRLVGTAQLVALPILNKLIM
jgi:hypothetical protein